MLRLRRYRLFLVLAVFATFALYQFSSFGESRGADVASVEDLKNYNPPEAASDNPASNLDSKLDDSVDKAPEPGDDQGKSTENDNDTETEDLVTPPKPKSSNDAASVAEKQPKTSSTASPKLQKPSDEADESIGLTNITTSDDEPAQAAESPADPVVEFPPEEHAQGRFEVTSDNDVPKVHWTQLPEHFPVPTESLIALPTGRPKAIPKIQHAFASESPASKSSRQEKLEQIKNTFAFSWQGYRKNAWMQDELSPVSGRYRNPFCGWAATLVDSLDALWMMGLKEEFEEAAQAVKDIDFTTSIRSDLPLFEVTIRYLGGLIAAYDISDGAYNILLDKAVELAEILMGSFDTPNRMPMTFYLWKPTFASQPHRARTRVVLAEIGSLSLEFTRLAQITKEAKYYDAIARITNELEVWQNNTKLPGIWPKSIDASGCKKPEVPAWSPLEHSQQKGPGYYNAQAPQIPPEGSPATATIKIESSATKAAESKTLGDDSTESGSDSSAQEKKKRNDEDSAFRTNPLALKAEGDINKRQLADEALSPDEQQKPDCEPQGLSSPPGASWEEFTLGGMADSVFEYLPKEFMLLGGLEAQYRKMYEMSMEASKKHLLYRPMIEDEKRNILFSGQVSTNGELEEEKNVKLKPEATHLSCFTGGMFAVGAKIFDREGDMDIAKRLTDGCVWAYEMTPTGIMPEHFLVVPCDSKTSCPFNQTLWYEKLDPYHPRSRAKSSPTQAISDDRKEGTLASTDVSEEGSTVETAGNTTATDSGEVSLSTPLVKRQLGEIENEKPERSGSKPDEGGTKKSNDKEILADESSKKEKDVEDRKAPATPTVAEEESEPEVPFIAAYTPPPIPSQEEYAKSRIESEKLPGGVVRITGSKYILRPEAIESVFIMYRTTGDNYWREKGWAMFTAIQNYTQAEYGASAISDVMNETPYPTDEMESFWLAETLKYFYLLFSDPDVVSLDDYVLNTEAHPFKRPK